MNYIVIDLEWNQSSQGKLKRNKEIPFEIIEIGAIKMDSKRNIIGEYNQLICPKVYHDMNQITESLIKMQMEDLERGRPFEEVIVEFMEWCGDDYKFCTWGPLDLTELQRNMRFFKQKELSDGPLEFLDLQKIFSLAFGEKTERHSLENAVDQLKIEKDIPFHRAFSDAYYTAKIFEKIPRHYLRYVSFDTYNLPKSKEKEIKIQFDDYYKYISREFKTKESATGDKEVMSTKCYLCGKVTKRRVKWFTPNNKHYYNVSICEEHGYMKSKVRIRKSEKGLCYAVKTMRFIDEKQVNEIIEKKERAKMLKKQRKEMEHQKKLEK